MKAIEYLIQHHWDDIAIAIMWIAAVINGHTKNWKKWPGVIGKFAGLIVKITGLWTADKPEDWEPGDPDRRTRNAIEAPKAAAILFVLACSCSPVSIQDSLHKVHLAAVSAREIGFPVINGICKDYAYECRDAGKTEDECETLKKCQVRRASCGNILKSVHLACAAGILAAAGDDRESALYELSKASSKALEGQQCIDFFIEGS